MENFMLISMARAEFRKELKEIVKEVLDEQKQNSMKKDDKHQELISRSDLLKKLKVSASWLYNRMKEGSIKYIRKGRRVFFNYNEIFIDLQKQRGTNE